MRKKNIGRILVAAFVVMSVPSCASMAKVGAYADAAKSIATPSQKMGYEWDKILPGPPAQNTALATAELDEVRSFQAEPNSPRRAQAAIDNGLDGFTIYGAIIGPDFSASSNPELLALWTYAGRQLLGNSNSAKDTFPRPRPFLASPEIKACIEKLPGGSSYPSGHSAWGWLSAQILARLYPNHASAILGRGREYGHSRVVCGVHYPSDVADGRLVGDAILLSLDRDPEFARLFEKAREKTK